MKYYNIILDTIILLQKELLEQLGVFYTYEEYIEVGAKFYCKLLNINDLWEEFKIRVILTNIFYNFFKKNIDFL
jgi:hypothetical protein